MREKRLEMKERSMSNNEAGSDIRPVYKHSDLGQGVRGKYLARVRRGSNLVVLGEQSQRAFPDSEAVNQALLGLLD